MGMFRRLEFVEGHGAGMEPGRTWGEIGESLARLGRDGRDAAGQLAATAAIDGLEEDGLGVADLSTEEWAVIGSRFSAGLGSRSRQCEGEEGFSREIAQRLEGPDRELSADTATLVPYGGGPV
jgi:hypothetical protein